MDLGDHLSLIPKSSYSIDAQVELQTVTEAKTRRSSTVDVAWLKSLTPSMPIRSWVSSVLSDVVVAWEVDSARSRKAIRTSIDNLGRLNPRLGIEFLLIGGSKETSKGFESRLQFAVKEAEKETARIVVFHDVIFSDMYFRIRNAHPQLLYDAYLEAAEEPELANLIEQKWRHLLRKTRTKEGFENGLEDRLLNKLKKDEMP